MKVEVSVLIIIVVVALAGTCLAQGPDFEQPGGYRSNLAHQIPPPSYLDQSYSGPATKINQYVDEQAAYYKPANYQPANYQPVANGQVQPGARRYKVGAQLRGLGKVGLESGKRAIKDFKPVLDTIRKDINQYAKEVKKNPRVARAYDKFNARVGPILEKGSHKLEEFAAKSNERAKQSQHSAKPAHSMETYAPTENLHTNMYRPPY